MEENNIIEDLIHYIYQQVIKIFLIYILFWKAIKELSILHYKFQL